MIDTRYLFRVLAFGLMLCGNAEWSFAAAEKRTVTSKACATFGDDQTPASAVAAAKALALQKAVEQIAVFVRSNTTVVDLEFAGSKIESFSSGLIENVQYGEVKKGLYDRCISLTATIDEEKILKEIERLSKQNAGPDQALVLEAQESLAKLGYKVDTTGILDIRTTEEIKRFELSNGLPVTGMIDIILIRELRKIIKAGKGQQRFFKDCLNCPEMVVVPPGTVRMGSEVTELGRSSDEGPIHTVDLSSAFAVGRYEITYSEWMACVVDRGCGGYVPDDHGWGTGKQPVTTVNYKDVSLYLRWISKRTGQKYRLLSEAEWEYAARANTTSPFFFGARISNKDANFSYSYREPYNSSPPSTKRLGKPSPVGSFPVNAFGLFDMHGNVAEWVADCSHSYSFAPNDGRAFSLCSKTDSRILRGGAFALPASSSRSAARFPMPPQIRELFVGFRVARDLSQ